MTQIDASIPLQIKTFQPPDIMGAYSRAQEMKVNQQNMQMNDLKLADIQKEHSDVEKMDQSLQGLDPNDPHYDDKAIENMRKNGVSDARILNFKSSHLKVENAQIEKQLHQQDLKDKEFNAVKNMSDYQKQQAFDAATLISDTSGDVVSTYDSAIKAMGNNPTPQGKASATASAKAIYDAHITQLLNDPTISPELKKMIQVQAQKTFNIDQVRDLWTINQRHIDVLKSQGIEATTKQKQVEAAHAETQAKLEENKIRAQTNQANAAASKDRAQGEAAGQKLVQVVDPATGKISYDIIDMKKGTVTTTNVEAAQKPGGVGSQATQRFNNTVLTNAHQMSTDIKNIVDLEDPSGAFWQPHKNETLVQAAKRWAGNKVTGDNAQAVESLMTGIGKNIITVEQGGRITGQKLTDEMQRRYKINPGMSIFDQKYKLALMRQDLEKAIEVAKASGTYNKDQINVLDEDLKVIKKAVPYSPDELADAKKGKNPSFREANEPHSDVDQSNPLLR